MGAGVTSTVRSGITDFDYFYGEEDLLMLGMFSALISAALWLFFATKWSLPVSTTQSIVGSIIGFTIVDKGTDAIHWENVIQIIIWWVATPVTAAIFVTLLFIPIRNYLLRRPNDSYQMVLKWWPFFIFLVLFVSFIFLMEKGIKSIDIELPIGVIIAIAFGVGCFVAFIGWIALVETGKLEAFVRRRCKDKLLNYEDVNDKAAEMTKTVDRSRHSVNESITKSRVGNGNGYGSLVKDESDRFDGDNNDEGDQNEESFTASIADNVKEQLMYGMNVDILADLSKKEENIRNEAEKFDPQCEEAFAWLQVLTASFAILAHGSNDVANAVAPFAGLFYFYTLCYNM